MEIHTFTKYYIRVVMKILVVSDAHGNIEEMMNLLKVYPNMDMYLDAGDNLSSLHQISPYRSVRGNCDYYPYDEKVLIRTSAGNLFMKHLPYLTSKEKEGIRIFIHGHTHVMKIKESDNIITLCPGSISLPRDNSNGTFAIITIEDDNINIDIIDILTKKVLLHF